MFMQDSICEIRCAGGTKRKLGSKNENAWKTAHFSQVVKFKTNKQKNKPTSIPIVCLFFLANALESLQIHDQTNAVKSTALESRRSSFESQLILLPAELWEDDLIFLSLNLLISKVGITLLIPQFCENQIG